jgi:hypothetical protein
LNLTLLPPPEPEIPTRLLFAQLLVVRLAEGNGMAGGGSLSKIGDVGLPSALPGGMRGGGEEM